MRGFGSGDSTVTGGSRSRATGATLCASAGGTKTNMDAAAEARGYQNRSEIIRDLARAGLQQSVEDARPSGQCVAALVYVYDHAARDLSKRLVQNFHGHHDLSLATLHVHLDDNSCMEVTALKGASGEVRHFADHIIAERGVRYGRVVMIPTVSDKKPKARKHGHHD